VRISERTHASDSRGDTLRRITKAALGGVAGCALVLGGTQAASGALSAIFREQSENLLTDPLAAKPFDMAKATITIAVEGTSARPLTTFNINLTKIDPSIAGTKLGSHLHTGPCVEESGGSAGPHYNHDVVDRNKIFPVPGEKITGRTAEVSDQTEVWFDLRPDEAGVASDETTVQFLPKDPDGVMSVVVHVAPTNTDPLLGLVGGAGPRQACFPLSVSGIFPTE
jgi:Cu/Zn superoxide dismutase